MPEYLNFPKTITDYFTTIDTRLNVTTATTPTPADIDCYGKKLPGVRAVMWDIYGTLFSVGVGDLEASLDESDRLQSAAAATLNEFHLAPALRQLTPDQPPAVTLRDLYLRGIHESHQSSRTRGIEYPEVVIENIWLTILQQCSTAGYQPPTTEPLTHTALRCAYFFDSTLQQTSLYPHAAQCLITLSRTGRRQGIVSNAQFYTPWHLRRLLQKAPPSPAPDLSSIITPNLCFFSYQLGFSKPNLQTFRRARAALQQLNITAAQTLYIGNDMLNDIWGATQVGWHTVLYAGDRNQTRLRPDDPRCTNLKSDVVITALSQLLDLLPEEQK